MNANLAAFFERHGEHVAEATWIAALGAIEHACALAREGNGFRFNSFPRGELRRLRDNLAVGLMLARLAVALQDDHNDVVHALMEPAREAARLERLERLRLNNPSIRRRRARQSDEQP